MERERTTSAVLPSGALPSAPIVQAVDAVLASAARRNASDVHFEPNADALRVRLRVDGVLQELRTLPASMTAAVASRLKVMARMDIAERRLPQDGRIVWDDGRGLRIEARASALPTIFGEKLVLRLVRHDEASRGIADLGLDAERQATMRRALEGAHGIILVSGPTGSGKTTTLYALLAERNDVGRNIVSVEDPVERRLAGINQVQVNEDIGLSFAATLRALLRQDPDVIMIGEIRDQVTAEIAFRAALTGHLVLSTLHTEDAASCVTRLVDMGIAPYLIGAALRLVVAQRLVRLRCRACGGSTDPSCPSCGGRGASGRAALFEVMEITEALRESISRGATSAEVRATAIAAGMQTLAKGAQRLVALDQIAEAEAWSAVGHPF